MGRRESRERLQKPRGVSIGRQALLTDGTCAVKNRVVRRWFLHVCTCAQEGANTAGAAWLLEPEIRNTVSEMMELR